MSKVIKGMEIADLKSAFTSVRDLVVLKVDKLDAQKTYNLRKTLRSKNIKFKVVKNSIARKVLRELGLQIPDKSDYWKGPSALAWGAASIKDLSTAIEAEVVRGPNAAGYKDKVVIKGAVADGQPVAFAEALKMPTRIEVIGEIVNLLTAAASQIAGCLTGPAGQIASQIEKIGEKKEEGAPAA